MQQYDSIIIGTGQSGPSLARRLTGAGQTVAVIERKFFGGTCVNTGCTPTKTLVASAYAAHLARRATEFGVTIPGQITVDMKAVKARERRCLGRRRATCRAIVEEPQRLHRLPRTRPFHRSEIGGGRRSDIGGRSDFHQCGRASARPADRRSRPGRLSDQQFNAGCG